jgi:putative hemolysin
MNSLLPLLIFLLGCAAVYLGAIGSAFSALMKLSLRVLAERSDRPSTLEAYLDEPIVLFTPVRLLLGVVTVTATALFAGLIGTGGLHHLVLIGVSGGLFVGVFELLLPLLIVGRDPERVLEILLPSFNPLARLMRPLTEWTLRMLGAPRRPKTTIDEGAPTAGADSVPGPEPDQRVHRDERHLLKNLVDFEDTLVREIMTPRPDIVAIKDDATIGDLLALFREQEYSRFPVYKDSLDNIAGFVFVKDLVALDVRSEQPLRTLLRSATIVPESKRVSELLKQFQRQRAQIAIVVDEYGGTAGLVTIEDMLEEIVGEIRDEYDVEAEPIVEEATGRFVINGNVSVDYMSARLRVDIDREGFETVGGYLMTHLGRVPAVGEHIDVDGLHVEVLDVQRRRVNKVRITRQETAHAMGSDRPS